MVQGLSSWFPRYDRNPQPYVPNIFFAKPADYQKATINIRRRGIARELLDLPLVKAAPGPAR
jgi:predicted acyl esterase